MNIASTEELSDRDVIVAFKVTITTRQDQSFKQNRQKDWDSLGSRQKEENKHQKTSSTDERMERRESNTSINLTKGHIMSTTNKKSSYLNYF